MESSWIFTINNKYGVKILAEPSEDLTKLMMLREIFRRYHFAEDERIIFLKISKREEKIQEDKKTKAIKSHMTVKKNTSSIKEMPGCQVIAEDKEHIFVLCYPQVAMDIIAEFGCSREDPSIHEIFELIKSGRVLKKEENKEERKTNSKDGKTGKK